MTCACFTLWCLSREVAPFINLWFSLSSPFGTYISRIKLGRHVSCIYNICLEWSWSFLIYRMFKLVSFEQIIYYLYFALGNFRWGRDLVWKSSFRIFQIRTTQPRPFCNLLIVVIKCMDKRSFASCFWVAFWSSLGPTGIYMFSPQALSHILCFKCCILSSWYILLLLWVDPAFEIDNLISLNCLCWWLWNCYSLL